MDDQEAFRHMNAFSMGLATQYLEAGSPPHETVVALLVINPEDETDAFVWIGPRDLAGTALQEALPSFKPGQRAIEKFLGRAHERPGFLRVFVFASSGARDMYLATSPKAQA